jgi:hypothetical protein
MKHAVAAGARPEASSDAQFLAKDSALSLLARSVGFGHGRLALIRLLMAVQVGADIPQELWAYCLEAASLSKDDGLRALFLRSARAGQVALRSQTTPTADTHCALPLTSVPHTRSSSPGDSNEAS